MGAEYFKLAALAGDDKLSTRIGRGRAQLTAMLAGKLLESGGQIYLELCILEMLLSEWTEEVRLIEVCREKNAERQSWRQWLWRQRA